jgi:hypothetical protein
MDPVPLVGAQTAEGVAASNAPAWHALSYDGTGARVAVIDAGFTGYEGLLGSDLPGSVTTYDWTGTGMGGTEHGTACGEIVYDMAPGIAMDFHKVSTEVEIGNAVDQAITDGVDIISMSLILLLNGPGDGSGSLADIVSDARSNGILFAVGAGNNAEHAWSGFFNNDGADLHLWASAQNVNFFGPGDGSAYVIPAGSQILVGLHWDDWTAVDQDYDMILVYWDGDSWEYVTESSNVQNGGAGQTPQELITYVTPVAVPYGVVVVKSNATRDVCLRLLASHLGPDLDERVPGRSLVFPGDSPDAITVGALDVTSYNLEVYSSRGPTFGPGGACAGGSTKPDITAYAKISTVSFGPKMFAGTSPAIPHVAGAAALLIEAFPDYTVDELQADLEANAIDRGSLGKDNLYGSGRLYLGNPPESQPELSIDPLTVDVGSGDTGTFTITNTGEDHSILSWTASPVENWITVDPSAGSIRPDEGPVEVTVTVDRTQLSKGGHTGAVTVTSNAGDQDITITVDVPDLLVDPTSLDVPSYETDLKRSFSITNASTGTLAWTIAIRYVSGNGWVAVNPTSGSTTTETDTVEVTVDRAGQAPGTYEATLTVNAGDAGKQDVTVTMDVGITISGTVRDISDENNSVVPGARLSVVEYEPYSSAVCDGDGSFEITNVPPNEKMHIVIRGPSGGDVEYVHTYSPYFTTRARNIVEQEGPIIQKSETDWIVMLIGANPRLGIVGGAVETTLGDEFEGVDGVKMTLTTLDGAPIDAPVVYKNGGGDWDPDLEETSMDGGFAIYNVEAVPRDVRVVAQKDGWSFGLIEARVYPYKASPEAVTVAPVVGQAGGGGAPVGGGGGGGGGCFISTSQRNLSHSPLLW